MGINMRKIAILRVNFLIFERLGCLRLHDNRKWRNDQLNCQLSR